MIILKNLIDHIQVGATVDGQVIFSQESYIPRSAMLNLTANIFGENLNVLEVGARAEGFEAMVEELFGPDGYFREDTFHKLLQTLRNKRDVDSNEAVSDFQQTFNNDYDEQTPRGNMYMRMFGRDQHYSSFNGLNDLARAFWPSPFFGANSKDVDFTRSTIFLDGKIVVPTVAGLPLDLAVNGTSTISLKSSTQFELSNIFLSGSAAAEVHIFPTATMQVTGLMSVDAKTSKTGLKSVTKMHTSTFFDAKVAMDGGKLVKAEINMPRDQMEILDVSVDFFTLQNGDFSELESKHEVCIIIALHCIGIEMYFSCMYNFM
jgi:hypothetical protein